MNNWIKKLNSIKLFVPEELRNKEYISLSELFNSDENASLYQDVLESLIKKEIDERLNNELINKSANLKKDFEIEYNNKIKEYKEKTDELLKISYKEKVQSVKDLLEREKEAVTDLKNRLDSNEKVLITLKQDFSQKNKEEIESLIKEYEAKIIEIKRECEGKLTSTEIGEYGEEFVISSLRKLFPEDNITKPNSALGEADVLHKLGNGQTFYYEVKNRQNWSMKNLTNFSDKVRTRDDAAYFFISKALPKRHDNFVPVDNDVFYDSLHNIYITSFENYLPLVFAIRKLNLTFYKKLEQVESANEINKRILDFVSSSEFQNYFALIKDKFLNLEKVFKNIQKETSNGIRLSNEIDMTISNFKIDIETKLKT